MRNKLVRIIHRKLGAIVVTACLALGFASTAQASVIPLTGGDPGEGYAPKPVTVYAYHLTANSAGYSLATDIMQGVSFLPFTLGTTLVTPITQGSVTIANGTAYPANAPSIGGSANDLALRDIGNAMAYGTTHAAPTPLTLTLGGLVSGNTYQLDLFWQWGGPNPPIVPATYKITDANGSFIDTIPGVSGTYYDVRESVVADSLGKITVVATNLNTDADVPYLSGFSVTTIPELSAMTLVGVGGLLVVIQRRHARV